jgi:hypothetical protein
MLPGRHHRDQRLVNQPGQHLERHPGGDGASSIGIESADEHSKTSKRGLLDGIEEGVTPLDRCSNTAVVRGRGPPRPAQFTQVGVKTGDDLVRRHDADSGGSQLDSERELVHSGADVEDGGFCVCIWDQLRTPLPRALEKQTVCMLGRKRLQSPHSLTRQAERLAARRQNSKVRAGAEQRHAEVRARVEHMLTVVEHQQHVPIGQVPSHRICRRVSRRTADAEYTRRLSRDVLSPTHRGKVDQPDAIGPLPRLSTTDLDGRAGLAYASRAGQRDQPGSAQHLTDGLEFSCAAKQPREGRGDRRNRPELSIGFGPFVQPAHD